MDWLGIKAALKMLFLGILLRGVLGLVKWTYKKLYPGGIVALEGNELEKQLGEYGAVVVDVTPELKLKVSIEAHVDLIAELEKLAAKTATPVDDAAIAWIKGMLAKPVVA